MEYCPPLHLPAPSFFLLDMRFTLKKNAFSDSLRRKDGTNIFPNLLAKRLTLLQAGLIQWLSHAQLSNAFLCFT